MADNKTTQTQMPTATGDEWRRMGEEQFARWMTFQEGMIEKTREQAHTVINEAARLQREAIAYSGQMAAEWMKMGVDAARRTMTNFSQR